MTAPMLARRRIVGLVMAAPAVVSRALAQKPPQTAPPVLPEGAHVTIAGPEGSELEGWARTLLPALGSFIPGGAGLRRGLAGGVDGITGANQFAAQAMPDGGSALLVPGAAALAWLLGDPRVQFDVARWIPLLSGFRSLMLVGRLTATQLTPGQKLRIGVSSTGGPEAAALLGLSLLGLQPLPVTGLLDPAAMEFAFAQQSVDMVLVHGSTISPALLATGAQPICVLGFPDPAGLLSRDPAVPSLPHLGELLNGFPAGPRSMAWHATAIAAQMAFALVLPHLTAEPTLALWRHAAKQACTTPDLQAMATAQDLQLYPDAAPASTLAAAPETRQALLAWLAERQR